MKEGISRRQTLLRGFAGITVIAAGGLVWRAWDNGAFSVGQGPAYEAWHNWRTDQPQGPMALVRAGILAASAHNTQPWRFLVSGDRIELQADRDRHLGSFDPFRREMHLSLGCALENMVHAARAQGLEARVEALPGHLTLTTPLLGPAAVVRLAPGERVETDLYRAIPLRHTNRGAFVAARQVSADLRQGMQQLVAERSALRLFLFDDEQNRKRLGSLIVSATETITSDPQMAADSARWFRFDWKSVQQGRDGITLDTVGLPPLVIFAAKILPMLSTEEADRQWRDTTRDVHVATAPLLGLIAVKDLYDRPTTLSAGRLWQRLHLWATARGLAAHPLNQPAEIVDRERELNRPPRMAEALAELTGDPDWTPTFVFRLGYAEQPAGVSPRRPLEAVLAA